MSSCLDNTDEYVPLFKAICKKILYDTPIDLSDSTGQNLIDKTDFINHIMHVAPAIIGELPRVIAHLRAYSCKIYKIHGVTADESLRQLRRKYYKAFLSFLLFLLTVTIKPNLPTTGVYLCVIMTGADMNATANSHPILYLVYERTNALTYIVGDNILRLTSFRFIYIPTITVSFNPDPNQTSGAA